MANKERLLRSSIVFGMMTLLSRVSGLARDIVIAKYFGSSLATDAFFIAFKIPNFLRRLFAEGAFSQAFVPVLSEYKVTKEFKEVKDLIDYVAGTLSTILIFVSIIGMLVSPILIYIFAPGFYHKTEQFVIAGQLLRIVFPYIFFISLTAFSAAIMNTYGKFALSAFTPVMLNISMIGATIFMTPLFDVPIMALAWGVIIAGASQLILQFPFLIRSKLLPFPKWGWHHAGTQRIIKLMTPVLLSVSVSQISLLLDTILASFLQTGSVSWLYYSERLVELPLGIFGVAIGNVILPSLSKQYAANNILQFSKTLDWAIRCVLLISIPATIGLIFFAEPLLSTIFNYGKMNYYDILMSAGSLKAFAYGLTSFMMIKILTPGYFSRQNTKEPIRIAIKSLIASIILALILIIPLAHVGLALATSLSSTLNAFLLYLGLRKSRIFIPQKGWKKFFLQLICASISMTITLFYVQKKLVLCLENYAIMNLLLLVLIGIITYGCTLFIFGLRVKHLHNHN